MMRAHPAAPKHPHMASSRITTKRSEHRTVHAFLRRLRDEILDLYLDWRQEAEEAAEAYASWAGAPAGAKAARFLVYAAALDREEVAATTYPNALARSERLAEQWDAR